jgi:hypothetical protein
VAALRSAATLILEEYRKRTGQAANGGVSQSAPLGFGADQTDHALSHHKRLFAGLSGFPLLRDLGASLLEPSAITLLLRARMSHG